MTSAHPGQFENQKALQDYADAHDLTYVWGVRQAVATRPASSTGHIRACRGADASRRHARALVSEGNPARRVRGRRANARSDADQGRAAAS